MARERAGRAASGDPAALVFDLYGTLLDLGSLIPVCLEVAGAERAQALLTVWRQKQLEYSWLRSLMRRYVDFWAVTSEALEYAARRAGVSLDAATRDRLMSGWLRLAPHPEVPGALEALAPRRLAVLSNGSRRMLDEVLRSSGLREAFTAVLSVDEVETYKPSPEVYLLPERHLGVPREELLFVSANSWDVAGAASFGLPVAWLDRASQPAEALPFAADRVAPDLAGLAASLR